jgi:hypothetical protein
MERKVAMGDRFDDALDEAQQSLRDILLGVPLTEDQRKFAIECAIGVRDMLCERLFSHPKKNQLGLAIIAISLAYLIGPVDAWGFLPDATDS